MNSPNTIVVKAVILHWALLTTACQGNPVMLENKEIQSEESKRPDISTLPLHHKGVEDSNSKFAPMSSRMFPPTSDSLSGQKKYRPTLNTAMESTYTVRPKSSPKSFGDFNAGNKINEGPDPKLSYNPNDKTRDYVPHLSDELVDESSEQSSSSPEILSQNEGIKSKIPNDYQHDISQEVITEKEGPSRSYSITVVKPSRVSEVSVEHSKPRMTFGTEDRLRDAPGSIITGNVFRDNPYKLTRRVKVVEYMEPKANTGGGIMYQYKNKPNNMRTVETSVFSTRPKYLFNTAQSVGREYPKNIETFVNNPYLSFSDDPSTSPMSSGQPVGSGNPVKAK